MAKTKDVTVSPQEEFAYGHIIKALAGGLYPNKFHVIREYIQNGFDAIKNWKQFHRKADCEIKISIQKPSIFILDNGTGMDRHTLNEFRKVGFSKKMAGESAGFRGIGKLGGISVAKKLVVTTSPYGIAEKYVLEFDSEKMVEEVDSLKANKENISLNALIQKHTTLSSSKEDTNEHYTLIELQDIKPDSKLFFNKKDLAEYISRNVPVPFDPLFTHAKTIESDLRKFVADYNDVPISVDGEKIYKPFVQNLIQHKHILIWDKARTKKLAFCWYCENDKKGQIKPDHFGGLIYRCKNFAVGDNYLTRKTIWNTSSHLAFYFLGEVHVLDEKIIPTSQRDDFEQSAERDAFYKEAKIIASELNSIARESSDIRRAEEYVKKGQEVVTKVEKELKESEPHLRDLNIEKITQLSGVISNIEKRKKNIPNEDMRTKRAATKIVKKAKTLLKKVEGVVEDASGEFDIAKQLGLQGKAKVVYLAGIRTLKDVFIDKPDELERVIKAFHKNLRTDLANKTRV